MARPDLRHHVAGDRRRGGQGPAAAGGGGRGGENCANLADQPLAVLQSDRENLLNQFSRSHHPCLSTEGAVPYRLVSALPQRSRLRLQMTMFDRYWRVQQAVAPVVAESSWFEAARAALEKVTEKEQAEKADSFDGLFDLREQLDPIHDEVLDMIGEAEQQSAARAEPPSSVPPGGGA